MYVLSPNKCVILFSQKKKKMCHFVSAPKYRRLLSLDTSRSMPRTYINLTSCGTQNFGLENFFIGAALFLPIEFVRRPRSTSTLKFLHIKERTKRWVPCMVLHEICNTCDLYSTIECRIIIN